ncbi:MAG TPA: divalent-cation tolerance protein CutA [Thermoplasmata archaeon]|nr:divalent-cation tolerance protein CutA [Thermoplasmata archaeon]
MTPARGARLALVLSAFPIGAATDRIARASIDRRLAACVQRTEVRSTYRWRGRIVRDREWLLVFKTTEARAARLLAFLRSEHPYEVPEIVELPGARANRAYVDYLTEALSIGGAGRGRPRRAGRPKASPRRPAGPRAPGGPSPRGTRGRRRRRSRRTGRRP